MKRRPLTNHPEVSRRIPRWILFGTLLLIPGFLITGCAAGSWAEREVPSFGTEEYAPAAERSASGGSPASPSSQKLMATESADQEISGSFDSPAPAPADGPAANGGPVQPADGQPARPRLRVFSATLEMAVAIVPDARDRIILLAGTFGGYVESSSEDTVVIRVPAARFDEALTEVQGIGRVLHREVGAADVTDQFADIQNRLAIARTSRDRLLELLERSTDPEDQVLILREVRRLTEEIQRLESSLGALADQIAYSRITVRFVSQIAHEDALRTTIPFPWIAALDPVYTTVDRADSRIEIELPDTFAVFQEGRQIAASSATGVRFRAGGLDNEPAGDETFWQHALLHHLSPLYRDARAVETGSRDSGTYHAGVVFTSKDVQPYFFVVLVHVRNDELLIVEAFFPNEAEHDAFLPGILTAVSGDQP